jgi:hypothetical protein
MVERDAPYLERKRVLDDLRNRCWSDAGVRISGQDLRRVAGYNEPNTLYKWLKNGKHGRRFGEAINLPTTEFIQKALPLRPRKCFEKRKPDNGDAMRDQPSCA